MKKPTLDDFEKLLRAGKKTVEADNRIVEMRLAEMYRDAMIEAQRLTGELYLKLGDEITLPNAQKYNRLPRLMKEIEREYKKLTGKALTLSADTSAQNYTEAFYRYEWALESVTATPIPFGILPVEAIRKSVFSENMTLNIINTFKRNGSQQLFQIQAAITRGIAIGQSYQKTASSMKDSYNKGLSDALRVVRTESGRCYSEGYLKAHDDAAELGVQTRKRWIATLDKRTRDTHGALDGEYADKDGYFHSDGAKALAPHLFGVAAQDINCRCSATDEIEGLEPKFRRLKGFGLQPYQTFTEWAEPQGWTRAKGWPRVKIM